MNASWVIRVGLSALVVIGGLIYFVMTRDEETALRKRGAAVEQEQWRSGEPRQVVAGSYPDDPVEDPVRPLENTSVSVLLERAEGALQPDVVERFTTGRGQSADNLVLAAVLSGDSSILLQAASLFPEDPLVQLQLAQSAGSPQDRAAALATFRQLAPKNALGDFLAARRHFEAGNSAAALEEIRVGNQKKVLDDYSSRLISSAEMAYLTAGLSAAEAKLASLYINASPLALATLDVNMKGLLAMEGDQKQRGDAAGAEATALEGVAMSHFAQDQSKTAAGHLLALSAEQQFLGRLPEDREVPGLSLTVKARQAALDQWKKEFDELYKLHNDRLIMLNAREITAYAEKQKAGGEVVAVQWLKDTLDHKGGGQPNF